MNSINNKNVNAAIWSLPLPGLSKHSFTKCIMVKLDFVHLVIVGWGGWLGSLVGGVKEWSDPHSQHNTNNTYINHFKIKEVHTPMKKKFF